MKKILILLILLANLSCVAAMVACSDNGFVTGYYTPNESEFSSAQQTLVRINKMGSVRLDNALIQQVKIEG